MIIYSNYLSKVNLKSEKYVYYYFSQMIHLLPAPKIKIIIHKDKLLNFKYGILQAKNVLELKQKNIIKVLMILFLLMMLMNKILSKI